MRLVWILFVLLGTVNGQQIFRNFIDYVPQSLDPILSNDQRVLRLTAQLFDVPIETGLNEKDQCILMPGACALPEISKDGLSLTFTVLPDVRFHDDPCFEGGAGREVMASDLVFSLLRIADPSTKSPFWTSYLENRIAGLDAWREAAERDGVADFDLKVSGLLAEGRRLTIRLLEPYPQLLTLITQPWASIVPREAVTRYGSGFSERPIGSGPFRFGKRDALGNLSFVKNPSYHRKGYPKVDELRFEVIADPMKRSEKFLAGELDLCDVWPEFEERLMDQRGRLRESLARAGITLSQGPILEVGYLAFGMKHAVLSKLPVRKAITLAFDRLHFLKALYGARGVLANSPIPTGLPESNAISQGGFPFAVPSLADAKRFLEEAGHKDGAGIPELIIDAPGSKGAPKTEAALKVLTDGLLSIGIKAQIRNDSLRDFYSRVKQGDVQIAWMRWYADYADPENFLILFRSNPEDPLSNSNYGNFQHERFDQLYDQIKVRYPSPDRTALVVEAVDILRKELPWIFLSYTPNSFVVQKGVQGYRYNVLNHSLRAVHLTR